MALVGTNIEYDNYKGTIGSSEEIHNQKIKDNYKAYFGECASTESLSGKIKSKYDNIIQKKTNVDTAPGTTTPEDKKVLVDAVITAIEETATELKNAIDALVDGLKDPNKTPEEKFELYAEFKTMVEISNEIKRGIDSYNFEGTEKKIDSAGITTLSSGEVKTFEELTGANADITRFTSPFSSDAENKLIEIVNYKFEQKEKLEELKNLNLSVPTNVDDAINRVKELLGAYIGTAALPSDYERIFSNDEKDLKKELIEGVSKKLNTELENIITALDNDDFYKNITRETTEKVEKLQKIIEFLSITRYYSTSSEMLGKLNALISNRESVETKIQEKRAKAIPDRIDPVDLVKAFDGIMESIEKIHNDNNIVLDENNLKLFENAYKTYKKLLNKGVTSVTIGPTTYTNIEEAKKVMDQMAIALIYRNVKKYAETEDKKYIKAKGLSDLLDELKDDTELLKPDGTQEKFEQNVADKLTNINVGDVVNKGNLKKIIIKKKKKVNKKGKNKNAKLRSLVSFAIGVGLGIGAGFLLDTLNPALAPMLKQIFMTAFGGVSFGAQVAKNHFGKQEVESIEDGDKFKERIKKALKNPDTWEVIQKLTAGMALGIGATNLINYIKKLSNPTTISSTGTGNQIIENGNQISDGFAHSTTIQPGQTLDLSSIGEGYTSSYGDGFTGLMTSAGKDAIVDQVVTGANGEQWVHFLQGASGAQGKGYAWFKLEDLIKSGVVTGGKTL